MARARRASWVQHATRGVALLIFLAFLGSLAASGCGADGAVVGGTCASGYSQCGTSCVDLSSDSRHCGACDHACPTAACTSGVCLGEVDAEDGAGAGDSASDAGLRDGPGDGLDGSGGDAGTDPSDGAVGDGDTGDSDACLPPFDTPERCGSCSSACGPSEVCGPVDGGHRCLACPDGQVRCSGACFDLTRDPNHCGSCTTACPTLLCDDSRCVGSTTGHVVLIGHDYSGAFPSAQGRVLENAVFISDANPLRVLAYRRYAEASAVSNVTALLSARAALLGRSLDLVHTSSDADLESITGFTVLLVYDQALASAGTLNSLGVARGASLTGFARRGGVVVVLDGAGGAFVDGGASEMPEFVSATGLLSVFGHASILAGTRLVDVAPADLVGSGVPSPYASGTRSVSLVTEFADSETTHVIVPQGDAAFSDPVVVHKLIRP